MNESSIQLLTIIGSNLVIMLTFFGVSISLHNGIREEIRAIQTEIKDFHSRLAKQDSEFKIKMYKLEKNNRSRK